VTRKKYRVLVFLSAQSRDICIFKIKRRVLITAVFIIGIILIITINIDNYPYQIRP